MQFLEQHMLEGFGADLKSAAGKLNVELSEPQIEQLLKYLQLLSKWNRTYNLTAVRDPEEMLWRHLVDALSVVPFIKGPKVLDVGTGPGLPGIPLAIVYSGISFSLLDSNIKKTRFLTQSAIELGLKNVEVLHTRVELQPSDKVYDQILSRAFASLDKMVDLCHPLLSPTGQFLAMKGQQPIDEQEDLARRFQDRFRISEDLNLDVPGCEGQRHLIIIEPCST